MDNLDRYSEYTRNNIERTLEYANVEVKPGTKSAEIGLVLIFITIILGSLISIIF